MKAPSQRHLSIQKPVSWGCRCGSLWIAVVNYNLTITIENPVPTSQCAKISGRETRNLKKRVGRFYKTIFAHNMQGGLSPEWAHGGPEDQMAAIHDTCLHFTTLWRDLSLWTAAAQSRTAVPVLPTLQTIFSATNKKGHFTNAKRGSMAQGKTKRKSWVWNSGNKGKAQVLKWMLLRMHSLYCTLEIL